MFQRRYIINLLQILTACSITTGALWFAISRLAGDSAAFLGLSVFAVYIALGLRFGPKFALSKMGAEPVSERDAPGLLRLLDDVVALIPNGRCPTLYRIESDTPQAFALGGTNTGAIAVSDGLLTSLTPGEFRSVLAHELMHLHHLDGVVVLVSVALRNVLFLILLIAAWMIISTHFGLAAESIDESEMLILLLATSLVFLWTKQSPIGRELEADEAAVRYLGCSRFMVSALQKIDGARSMAETNKNGELARIYSHAEIEERLARLLILSSATGAQAVEYSLGACAVGELDSLLDLDGEVRRLML